VFFAAGLRVFVFLRFCKCLDFFAAALPKGLARCAAFNNCAALGISSLRSLIPSSTAALFSGLAPLRYADPLGTFGGSSFKPKQLRCLGAFCLKKTF